MMQIYEGKSVFGGIAIGKIIVYKKEKQSVRCVKMEAAAEQLARYRRAKEEGICQLQSLYEKAVRKVGEEHAEIFKMHQMLLADEGYNESVENIIRTQSVNAEYAVAVTGERFAERFAAMEDAYMRERAADVQDISERVLGILKGSSKGATDISEPSILVAEDLTPSETVQLDKSHILSLVTVRGSLYSHTAILARTMAIPALIDTPLPLDDTIDGKMGIVDGVNGRIYIEPEEEILARMKKLQEEELEKKKQLQEWKEQETVTFDGQRLRLCANIGNLKDLAAALENNADGIGLFRSEFLYLEREDYPTEEEQFQIYKKAAETMAEKPVIIRTLDIGADKRCDYFAMEPEENPALGCRAIRICLLRPEIFKTQLRALLRASVYGRLAIMYPMITSVDEVRKIKRLTEEVKGELREQNIAYGAPAQGIMIETPAAALISAELAREVDFFSVGTNDLTQYTLAMDRQNTRLDAFYNPYHPAVFRMIAMVVENGHKAGIQVGICGELGADQTLTREFLAMGVDELSVAPESILPIRRLVRETNVTKYREETEGCSPRG